MKKIKYISSILIIAFIFLFIGDMYVWNIDYFETEYITTTMYQPLNKSKKEMFGEIEKTAKKNNCFVFTVVRNIDTVYSETVTVYGMDGVKEAVSKKSSIQTGKYRSAILGDVEVKMASFLEIPEKCDVEFFYFIGKLEDARACKRELVDIYGGSVPKIGYVSFHAIRNVMIIWAIGILFILLLTLFETTLLKKEMIIRFLYGESLSNLVLKRIICDIVACIGYSAFLFIILKYGLQIHVDYHIKISIISIISFCLLNSLVYLRILFANYKSALSMGKSDKNILKFSYAFKIGTIIVVSIMMSVGIEMIASGYGYWCQKDFFEQYKDYSYVSVAAKDGTMETTEKLMLELLAKKNKERKAFFSVYLDNGFFSRRPCIMCNESSLPYMQEHIKLLKGLKFNKKVYFIVPEIKKEMAVEELKMLSEMYKKQKADYEVITYKDTIDIMGISNQGKIVTQYYKKPNLILDMTGTFNYFNGIYMTQACMFKFNDAEWKEYLNQNDISEELTFITNVYSNYKHILKSYQRILFLGSVLLFILLIIEIIVVRTVIYYECTINSVELAIRTTLGETILEKYQRLFLSTFISLLLSGISCFIIASKLSQISPYYILTGFLILGLAELGILLGFVRRIEKASVQRILKGNMSL
ncbi:hypothetical protein [[Clostridium] polysaccharolyticum]|uniref:Bacteriocin-associated integral membrane (Putative immunity) protein n=1 Tax=[Clostridium] polysaccharolyticum TaxID=29364 RepID=A0A1I0FFI2_9FIRM|nr:hypothetical protein [[Clostridium] polysaccharolyticum]SET56142.1 hypothetical protein SAMN04487772_13028 [[Clostridium] polysaccharolyticum]